MDGPIEMPVQRSYSIEIVMYKPLPQTAFEPYEADMDEKDVNRIVDELKRRGRDRSLERLRNQLANLRAARQAAEEQQIGRDDVQDAVLRVEGHMDRRNLLRRLSLGNLRLGNLGLGPRRRDDVYTCDELVRQIQRERHGGCPCSNRNCLCGGDGDDGHQRRTRPRSRRRHDHGYKPQQVNFVGSVFVDGRNPGPTYVGYEDWPPVDIYRRRWGGLLPDKRLPWLTEDTFLDGNDIMRVPRRPMRRGSFGPNCYFL